MYKTLTTFFKSFIFKHFECNDARTIVQVSDMAHGPLFVSNNAILHFYKVMNKYLLFSNLIDHILHEKGKSFKFINFIFCSNTTTCCTEKNVVF